MCLNTNVNNNNMLNTARTDETLFSYSNRSNASMQILKADFIAFTFFLKEKNLKTSALNISKSYSSLDNKNIDNHLNDNSKDVNKNTHQFNSKDIKKFILDNFNTYVSNLNVGYFNKHTYMEFFKNLNVLENVGNNFNDFFYEFETYVIKLFSIHPTLGSTYRGTYIDDDGSMLNTLLDYIRSYESSMYLLSQKQQYYFYVSLFLLIVLLRNFRRFLHHYKSSNTLSDLMLMMAEAISMCQNHIYKSFVNNKSKLNKQSPNKYTDLLLSGQFYSDPELEDKRDLKEYLESLKMHNNNCLKIKEDIFRLCKDEFKNQQPVQYVDDSVMDLDTTYASEDGFVSEDTEFTSFYDNISSMSTRRDEFLDSTLYYDKSEIAYLSDFNLILDDKICWWISELCSLCNLYCKLGHSPALMSRRYTKLVLVSDTTVLPKLSNVCFTNLDFNRSLLVRKSIHPKNKKTKQLRSEAKAKGYTQSPLCKTKVKKLDLEKVAKLLSELDPEDVKENKLIQVVQSLDKLDNKNKEEKKEKEDKEHNKENKETQEKEKMEVDQEEKEDRDNNKDNEDNKKEEKEKLESKEKEQPKEEKEKEETKKQEEQLFEEETQAEVQLEENKEQEQVVMDYNKVENKDNKDKEKENKQEEEKKDEESVDKEKQENKDDNTNNNEEEKEEQMKSKQLDNEKENEDNKKEETKEENNKEVKDNKEQEKKEKHSVEKKEKEKVDKSKKENEKKSQEKQKDSSQDSETTVPKPKNKRSEYNKWTDDETNLFLEAINSHGTGNWSYISKMFFHGKRSQMQLKDKWVNLQRYKKVKQVQPQQKKVEDLVRWVLVTSEVSE